MKCQTPDCSGEPETRTISHSVIYRQRAVVVHGVPASVCLACGDATLAEETAIHLEDLLRRKARSRMAVFSFVI